MKNKILVAAIFVFVSICGIAQTDTTLSIRQDAIATPDTNEFLYVEELPDFPGGEAAKQKFFAKNIKYPKAEKKKRIEGTVYVRFMVEKDGSITNIHIVKEVQNAPGFSEEALRVIKLMPPWTPGKLNGKLQRYEITQPIRFAYQKM